MNTTSTEAQPMEGPSPLTVRDLIEKLSKYHPDRLVVLSIAVGHVDPVVTFVTRPTMSTCNLRQTYLGDRDILRIEFDEDEP